MTEVTLTEQQEADCREIFDMIDENKSGSLEKHEILKVMQGLGLNPTEQELDEKMKENDMDGNEQISYDDFKKCYLKMYRSAEQEEEQLKDAFRMFDKDGSGKIDREELKQTMGSIESGMADEDIDAMMDEADVNKDGQIDYEEFVKVMMQKE